MTFDELLAEYYELKGKLASGVLPNSEFARRVGELNTQDAQGRWWTIGAKTGSWYVSEGGSWVESDPPPGVEAPSPVVATASPTEAAASSTVASSTVAPSTVASSTVAPSTVASSTVAPSTVAPKFCPHCGEAADEGDTFCGHCGSQLTTVAVTTATASPTSAAAPPTRVRADHAGQPPPATPSDGGKGQSASAGKWILAALALVAVATILFGGAWWLAARSSNSAVNGSGASAPSVVDAPPAVELVAGDLVITEGDCTLLEWKVTGASAIHLNQQVVWDVGTDSVCPIVSTDYVLVARSAGGQTTERSVTVEVTGSATGPVTTTVAIPPDGTSASEAAAETADTVPPPATEPLPTTSVPPSPVPTTPAPTPASTVEPTPDVHVEFYPDNNQYEIPKSQLCTAVIWKTSGVTEVQLERDGHGRKAVGDSGREEVCFGNDHVTMVLHYRLPDGSKDRRQVDIRKK